MRIKRTFYLNLMVLWVCFIFSNSSIFALAQSSDKNFGSSLKKFDKKKRESRKQKSE